MTGDARTGRPPATATDDAPDPRVRAAGQAPLVVDRAAIDAVVAHVGGDTTVERGGVLVGTRSPAGVHVTAAIRAERAQSHPSALTFTHEAWDEVNTAVEHDHPDQQIVGWYHSHPGFSVFLSEYDTFIHRNFFPAAWQVAYVVDPLLGEDGFFGWDGDEIVRYAGWDVRVSAGRGGAAVAEPAARPLETPTPAGRPRLAVTIIAAALVAGGAGFVAGQLLHDTPRQPVVATSTPLVRADGLLLTRTVRVDGDCATVQLDLTNPTASTRVAWEIVDVIPAPLVEASPCDGGNSVGATISAPGAAVRPGATATTGGYTVRIPHGVAADAAALQAWFAEQREQWQQLQGEPPRTGPLDGLRIEVGIQIPIPFGQMYADGSFVPSGSDAGWTVDDPSVVELDATTVLGVAAGETILRNESLGVSLQLTVTAAAGAASDATGPSAPNPTTPPTGNVG